MAQIDSKARKAIPRSAACQTFKAMGRECEIVVNAPAVLREKLASCGIARVKELDGKWSRFRSTSEITALNFAAGTRLRVSPDTVLLVDSLIGAWQATSGAFDPTLLPVLVEGGFSVSQLDPSLRTILPTDARAPGKPGEIRVFRATNEVQLPRGTTLDPGGLGKGLAADLVATELMDAGATSVMVDIGGDIRVIGDSPDERGWRIRIGPAVRKSRVHFVNVIDGGIATSNRLRRPTARVALNGLEHDMLDPTSLKDTKSAVASVSVVSATAGWSEAISKVPFVLGMEWGGHRLKALGVAAILTTTSGVSWSTPAWDEYATT